MADHDLLVRLLQLLTVESDRFAERFGERHRMHRTDLNALLHIMEARWSEQPMTPGRLAEVMRLSASATTSVLDRLESSGHVHRVRSASDRRRVDLAVDQRALELGREFFLPLNEAFTRAWAGFDEAERAVVARFLRASIEATTEVRDGLDEDHG
ncbi:MarR family winged helix-turn-helix transcriptional regulator [Actinosynnema mirum]|uniref:Transcriptional regulator, MarR family n=2 Tax=Actinosynnema TaxID=40566 RepID=C6WQW0_ACTMD|nr:MarR family transcriptional regulator [Actinosynnema mirum]ACU38800.1 transcriptional regulator, MarR family [Actinosynnema mirum DSM 43827]AXX32397.1 Transcriptional regulator, MarR family [Actinosynnema pretiosum subsp. pretiosum]